MSLTSVLLAPFALLFPAAEAASWGVDVAEPLASVSQAGDEDQALDDQATQAEPDDSDTLAFQDWQQSFGTQSFLPRVVYQVRIEQSLRIRIAPQGPVAAPRLRPDMLVGIPQRAIGTDFVERRMGRCLPVSSIAGVQPSGKNELILYLRDRRIVRAELERECRARDFYSGFYLSRNEDGRLCVDRDMLQSRSGAHCKLSEMRQLVEAGR